MTDKPPKRKRSDTDWERIEAEYRAGQLSVVEIGRQCGVSHTAINLKAKQRGWTRDLSEKVRREVAAQLAKQEVSEKLSAEKLSSKPKKLSAERESETVELAAARGVEIVRQHRKDIGQQTALVRRLVSELEESTIQNGEIIETIEAETAGDKNGLRRQSMLRAVALSTRAGVMKDLAGAAKILIDLERRAFNLDEPGDPPPSPETRDISARDRIASRIARISAPKGAGRDNSEPV